VQPEDIHLTTCCVEGRWFCAREDDAPRLAALLMFQALHRDMPVLATCRVGTAHSLLTVSPVELVEATGLSVRCSGALWRTPPLDEEEFMRALLRGSPLQQTFEEFLYKRRRDRVEDALREEGKQDPFSTLAPSLGPRHASPMPAAPQKAAAPPLLMPSYAPFAQLPTTTPPNRPRSVI